MTETMIPLPTDRGHEILRVEVGSTLHGTGLGVALEDHDEMGVYVEWPRSTIGLADSHHYVTRTAPEGEQSQAGDTDLVVYSLRKWTKLALNGNPSVILLFFAPGDKVMHLTPLGADLRSRVQWFSSKRSGAAFLGYMEQQRQRMVGQRGRAGRVRVLGDCTACIEGTVRDLDGLEDVCPKCQGSGKAVDWKYAMHMLRLGYQGIEFLTTGRLTLPVPGDIGDHLRDVRTGGVTFADVITEAESLEMQVKRLLAFDSPLPDEPDRARVERWIIDAHLSVWRDAGLLDHSSAGE